MQIKISKLSSKNPINQSPLVLLWGGRSTARIIDAMLIESKIGIAKIIFDNTLELISFDTSATFINDPMELKDSILKTSHYVVCIGNDNGYARFKTALHLEKMGLKPISVIHKTSFIDKTSEVDSGCQVMPFAIVHKFTKIGKQAILNTNSTIDHECVIGDGVHIMGNAAIAGKVEIGNYATVGTNATILPSLKIGEGSFIGAGSVVTRNVEPYSVVVGIPAKRVRKNEFKFHEDLLIQLTK